MGWTEIAKVALGLVLQELRARRRAEAFARGPARTQVQCDVCGADVAADASSMASHARGH